jgi:hypothetical protein
VERIRDAHPNFAYIHVIEDRANDTSDALRKIWGDLPSIAAGGFEQASAISTVEKHGGLVAFGCHFIALRPFFTPQTHSTLELSESSVLEILIISRKLRQF